MNERVMVVVLCSLTLLACGDDDADFDAGVDASIDAWDAGTDAGSDAEADAGCDPSPVMIGTIDTLDELSGLAASRTQPILFAHNDSGDGPRIFALAEDGSLLREYTLEGASSRDWEDIALGPHPGGGHALFVGDTGDNAARTGIGTPRSSIHVHRVPEPRVEEGAPMVLLDFDTFTFTYPDAPHDCESIFVNDAGDLFLLSKEDDGASTLFVARAPLADGELVRVADLDFDALPSTRLEATAADLSADGSRLLVRNYVDALLWQAAPGTSVVDLLATAPTRIITPREAQGEAITFAPAGDSFFLASEGLGAPLYRQQLCE